MIPGIVSAPLLASAQGMEAVATPSSVSRTVSSKTGGSVTVTTPSTTVTVTGGTAPYTHSWAVTGGAIANSPTSATTAFHASVPPDGEIDAVATDTVTDANGVVTTAECDATMSVIELS